MARIQTQNELSTLAHSMSAIFRPALLRASVLCLLTASPLLSAQIPATGNPATDTSVSGELAETGFSNERQQLIHHSLKILLDPLARHISVEDTITLPPSLQSAPLEFALNSNLTISNNTGNLRNLSEASNQAAIGINSTGGNAAPTNRYFVTPSSRRNEQLVLNYSGEIYDLAEQNSAEYAQSFSETSGIISELGVYLNKASMWIADINDELITFDMEVLFVDSANSWTAVSQGDRRGTAGWQSDDPMEEVYLVAADFTEYSRQADDVEVLAYLRQPDPNLAAKYLDATERYLALYDPLLGDYPFSKFALIENFWETGYGMPSFTLLGEQIIRFPFILESSYPHEILHNWWGNGVYPSYDSGNWSEGLTAYLADHLFQEMDGLGHEYRKEMLARYKNYVADGSDFPLSDFTSRNSAATQAVGYGKTLMLWHMLRIELGDELFLEGLRKLYSDYKFQRADYSDISALYSELSGLDLSLFFDQWVDRTGAPNLTISVEEADAGNARIMFAQLQPGDPYLLKVPVALFYEGLAEPQIFDISISQKIEGVVAENYGSLQAVLVDPYFDVFRQLDREETPPTIGELFGASEISFVLPQANREHWARMAESFAQGVSADIVNVEDIAGIPADRSVWILGRDNPLRQLLTDPVGAYGAGWTRDGIVLDSNEVAYQNRSSVVVARHPANSELAIGWIHVDDMIAMPGMIEKLPHYGKYSYLSFLGDEPTNDVKGVWSSPDSPMQWLNPDLNATINWDALPPVEPIATLPAKYLPERLLSHVNVLSSPAMQGRGLQSAGLSQAAQYIEEQFREAGLHPVGGRYIQRWSQAVEGLGMVQMENVIAMIPGSNRALRGEPVIIAAHYDHLGIDGDSGEIYTGADDNASGVSILVELAGKLANSFRPQRPILFVAFTGEESGLLGSKYFVENPPGSFQTEDMFAMVNLDAVGRLEGRPLQVFATDSAYEWPFMAQGIGFTIGVPSEFPAQTIASSDHVSFLNEGIPAIHVFSGTHNDYHRTSDSADKLDLAGMSDVALWVEEATVYLADNADPLRVTLDGAAVPVQSGAARGEREASLGTVPDFAYQGRGIRITGVTPGSAAEEAGLQEGDVLLRFNGQNVSDLQSYSNLLRAAKPGDLVPLQILRDQQTFSVDTLLKSR
jgi:aminopeptidase N